MSDGGEVQYKFAVQDIDGFLKRAEEKGVVFSSSTDLRYAYFKATSSDGSFAVLRTKVSPKRHAMDLKVRNANGEWQRFESGIESADTVGEILKSIGHECLFSFTKHRRTFKNEVLRLDLDTTSELGTFLEVKFQTTKRADAESLLSDLNFDISKRDMRSVIEIYQAKMRDV